MFKETTISEINENVFNMIGKRWMLITAGNKENFNMMTASWGGLGVLWNKNVAFCFIRPHRYTYKFAEEQDYFTLSFYDEKYRDALNICGTKSGRDIDKAKETGLVPVFDDNGVYFEQAQIVLKCKKLYFQDINPTNFLSGEIDLNYSKKDYHRMYVGEITGVLIGDK